MRRCTNCLHFHAGSPTFCSHCGRTFGVRICARGHPNARTATYCHECGSADLSTAAPAESLWQWLGSLVIYGAAGLVPWIVLVALILVVIYSIDWNALSGPLVALTLMLGLLY